MEIGGQVGAEADIQVAVDRYEGAGGSGIFPESGADAAVDRFAADRARDVLQLDVAVDVADREVAPDVFNQDVAVVDGFQDQVGLFRNLQLKS